MKKPNNQNDDVVLNPQNASPLSPRKGHVFYDNTVNALKVFNGTVWETLAIVNLSTPTGSIMSYAGSSAPVGWLLCNGEAIDRTLYSDLFSVIGEDWGEGDGSTTFNLPDLRGKFLRGMVGMANQTFLPAAVDIVNDIINIPSHGFNRTSFRVRVSSSGTLPTGLSASTNYFVIVIDANNIKLATSSANARAGTAINITGIGSGTHTITQWEDPDAASRFAMNVGANSGDNLGAHQNWEVQSHTHTIDFNESSTSGGDDGSDPFNIDTGPDNDGARLITSNATGGNETRPQNVLVNYIIKT